MIFINFVENPKPLKKTLQEKAKYKIINRIEELKKQLNA